ncbi:MAG: hypothetical protein EOM50_04225 [Erysipelotrichia bacterium]|nr:hypothetical protein [Erysipelotrichia bacterium]NCC54492.1 hypothetical protein [Erysipelotrichia bacterium]
MKKVTIMLFVCILLAGCSTRDMNEQQTKIYEGFKESLLNNGELISSYIPFDYTIKVKEKAGKYQYTVSIFSPRVAMKSIQMLILNPDDLTNDYLSSSKGIFDEMSYSLIPNQMNLEDGYMDKISLDGVSKTKDFRIYAMVTWKDVNGLNQYQAFFSFNVVNMKDMKAGS